LSFYETEHYPAFPTSSSSAVIQSWAASVPESVAIEQQKLPEGPASGETAVPLAQLSFGVPVDHAPLPHETMPLPQNGAPPDCVT